MAINPAEITTIRVGELVPGSILLTSKLPIENGTDLYQVTFQDLVNFMNINASGIQYEIKELWVNQAYIDNNFDITGLGINLLTGYALCNGNNGTPPMDGLVSVAYGTNYSVIGGFGGSKDAVVVEHFHEMLDDHNVMHNDGGSTNLRTGTPGVSMGTTNRTKSVGISGTNKNMQPYIILLKIMKL